MGGYLRFWRGSLGLTSQLYDLVEAGHGGRERRGMLVVLVSVSLRSFRTEILKVSSGELPGRLDKPSISCFLFT